MCSYKIGSDGIGFWKINAKHGNNLDTAQNWCEWNHCQPGLFMGKESIRILDTLFQGCANYKDAYVLCLNW